MRTTMCWFSFSPNMTLQIYLLREYYAENYIVCHLFFSHYILIIREHLFWNIIFCIVSFNL